MLQIRIQQGDDIVKWIWGILFAAIIGSIFISSFFFINNDAVKDETKLFIKTIIEEQQSELLSETENQQMKDFFTNFTDQNLPYPIIEGVNIPYFDEYTDPTYNENFMQYISVKYEQRDQNMFDTNIYFEYISYKADHNIDEVYFGQIVVRTYEKDHPEMDLISISPFEKQK